jgi:hypothetical protein
MFGSMMADHDHDGVMEAEAGHHHGGCWEAPWMDHATFLEKTARVQELDSLLEGLGANLEYCQTYFQSGAGVCEEVCGQECLSHKLCMPPLPADLMCATEFGRRVRCLQLQIDRIEEKRLGLKREWNVVKAQTENVENLLSNNEETQVFSCIFGLPCFC